MLYNQEKAIAFDFSEIGKVKLDVAPPQVIKTVKHKAWQVPGFPIPKALHPTVVGMLRERLKNGVLEYCDGPYRNPWFLVKKKSGKYRLVNAAMEINKHTVRDANLPPSVDEFSEEFAGCQMASLIDFFSGYDQIELDVKSRDLTGFQTPIGLLRMTTLPQGATNSVAQFVRIVTKILEDLIPAECLPFLDDIGVKGPTSRYNDEELIPGIRRFVMEHIQSLDRVLVRIERAGGTVGLKSQFCMDGINLVGFVCGAEGRSPDSAKVIKILEWEPCSNIREARAFIGVCVYYRIWIKDFSIIAEPIYYLFKKGVPWNWGLEQDLAMSALKAALTTTPALVKIIYSDGAGEIILAADASLDGWGAVLMQLDAQGKRHPSRYESGLWNQAERNYDATKRECRAVLKALRKVRYWLYGVHFVLETDANVLVAQLNRSATDLPGALVTRWIAYMRLFDFEVRHVPGNKHTAADGLSRRPRTGSDDIDEANEVDIDDFIDAEINAFRVASITVDEAEDDPESARKAPANEDLLEDGYSDKSWQIARYLTSLQRPEGLNRAEFRSFKRKALQYAVLEGNLYRRAGKNVPQRLVIDSDERKATILQELHDEFGHKGRESTYRRVADRYYWEHCYEDVKAFVASCERCQLRDSRRLEEALYPTWSSALFVKIGLDIVQMPPCQGKNYLVVAREDLGGWAEGRALAKANSAAVAKFI
jgi:ribonuclease HI